MGQRSSQPAKPRNQPSLPVAENGLYSPLSDEEDAIRLLRILPSSDFDGRVEPIRCEMKEVLLRDKPDDGALSHTWGPPTETAAEEGMTSERTCLILYINKRLPITENLDACLTQFGRDQHFHEWLWIDAV